MSDEFSPEVRNHAIWSTDARRLVDGKAADIYLEKIGESERPDLSDYEPAQWGLRLQESIARAAAERLKLNIKSADYTITHKKHEWMKSHFDYITEDNNVLLEIKNYRFDKAKNFGEDGSTIVPEADLAQCIHEAACHGIGKVILCVLFGGQELKTFPLVIDELVKDELIQQEAELWGQIQSRTPPQATNPEAARKIWNKANAEEIRIAGQDIHQIVREMKAQKELMKKQQEVLDTYEAKLQNLMGSASALRTPDGVVLATWKQSKDSRGFDREMFKSAMPDLYEQFCVVKPGSRRFLLKG